MHSVKFTILFPSYTAAQGLTVLAYCSFISVEQKKISRLTLSHCYLPPPASDNSRVETPRGNQTGI